MGWQPDGDSGTGQEPGSGLPGRDVPPRGERTGREPADREPADCESAGRDYSGRDRHLAGFARDGEFDTCPPSAGLAVALEAAAGAGWRCPGASHDELLGLLRQWQAVEAWAAAGRLGVLRALIRQDDEPLPGGAYRGDLPEGWSKSLTHEVALALSVPAGSAERQMWLAFDLHARLPGIGALLAAGQLTFPVAKAVAEPFQLLTDQDAAAAEAMILPELPGKTYGQAQQLAVRAAVTVDPDAAARRRQDAERNRARVQLFREESGAAALSGRDLPTDQTLAAHASVCTRAAQYQQSGVFPDETRMDQYRAAAYLDLLNNITAEDRITAGQLMTVTPPTPAPTPGATPTPGPTRAPRTPRARAPTARATRTATSRIATRTTANRTTANRMAAAPVAAAVMVAAVQVAAEPAATRPAAATPAAAAPAAPAAVVRAALVQAAAPRATPGRPLFSGRQTWSCRWRRCWGWPSARVKATALARSTRTCAGNWPRPPPQAR
jgi:hypothetical protein